MGLEVRLLNGGVEEFADILDRSENVEVAWSYRVESDVLHVVRHRRGYFNRHGVRDENEPFDESDWTLFRADTWVNVRRM